MAFGKQYQKEWDHPLLVSIQFDWFMQLDWLSLKFIDDWSCENSQHSPLILDYTNSPLYPILEEAWEQNHWSVYELIKLYLWEESMAL